MIEVKLFATFREGREKAYSLSAEKFHTASEILKELDIPEKDVAILLINGFHSRPESAVADGDTVSLFPPVAGG
ncbi:MAG: MoaD/ThiS family protein [Oscillospiraceae bacterium]|nr:MoaD/ThiS family protein [Oscillospiraceae bacterium]